MKDKLKETQKVYSFLWAKERKDSAYERWHFNDMQDFIDVPIVRGNMGIDIGSGCGYDTCIMAKSNPGVRLIALDISGGVFKTKEISRNLENIWIINGSALDVPIKDELLDFAYSFGVLHHTINPAGALKEIARVLKAGSPIFLYLYEDHAANKIKYLMLCFVKTLRRVSVIMPSRILYLFCYLLSPLLVVLFSHPARLLNKFQLSRPLAQRLPFNFGTHMFSLAGDLYDRFSAPIEHRFSREEVFSLLAESGFTNIRTGKLEARAGWVAWGYKTNA